MTKEEFIRRLESRAADADAMGATAPVGQVLRVVLEELGDLAAGASTSPRESDQYLTVTELAHRMGVSTRYVYDHHCRWPFTVKLGRKLRFSERGFERWTAAKH